MTSSTSSIASRFSRRPLDRSSMTTKRSTNDWLPQGPAQVGTDEPGSTGDDDVHLRSPFERNLNVARQGEGAGLVCTAELQSIDGRTVQSIACVEDITGVILD